MKSHHSLFPYSLTFIMVCCMVGISLLFNEPEIIFPEITALTIGAWLAPKQVWKTSPFQLVFLIFIYAVLGVVMVRYIHIPFIFKIIIAFTLCHAGLLLSHTTFAPLISACILPILMGTESWIYPLSATLMALFIVFIQKYLQTHGYHDIYHYEPVSFDYHYESILFLKRMIVVIIMSCLSIVFHARFFIAPPLIVAFFELSGNHKKLRHHAPQLYAFTVIMAFISAYLRYYLVMQLHISLFIITIMITLILLAGIYIFQIYFPPIGAIAILPLIIEPDMLLSYPILIAIGFACFIGYAFFITHHQKGLLTHQ